MNYTYILRCGDGSLYTGWTNNLKKRLEDHNLGRGAKYTRSHLPVMLVYYECFATKEEAMKREAAIKKLSRPEKERLIASQPVPDLSLLAGGTASDKKQGRGCRATEEGS